jgi:primosomal protein N' (replication factor Y)
LVRVPLGRREVLGVAWAVHPDEDGTAAPIELKPIGAVLDGFPPLGDAWRDLVAFAARYYQRSLGEIALAALPPQLRDLSTVQLARRLKRQGTAGTSEATGEIPQPVALTDEQTGALDRFDAEAGPFLLFGSTAAARPRCTCAPSRPCWSVTRAPRRW